MRIAVLLCLCTAFLAAAERATCVGGTLPAFPSGASLTLQTREPDALVLTGRKGQARIDYRKINLIEYGQNVGRRVLLGYMVSPIFLLSKARKHFVTIEFTDDAARQQAVVLRVDKAAIRALLATLEARSGRVVSYLDEEARRIR